MMTPKEFKELTVGNSYDVDKAYDVQCVDLFKLFEQKQFGKCHATGNGYAYGYWTCYSTNGLKDYFKQYAFSEVQNGDWVVWNKGAKACPNSHIAMYYDGKYVSQQANGKTEYISIDSDGILGTLRYNEYVDNAEIAGTTKTTENTSSEVVYTVAKGDTLSAIAKKYNTTYQVLADYNGIKDANKIYVGQQIKIPGTSSSTSSTTSTTYTVVKGDTLSAIAKKYGTTVSKLVELNGIKDANKIYVGQVLTIG